MGALDELFGGGLVHTRDGDVECHRKGQTVLDLAEADLGGHAGLSDVDLGLTGDLFQRTVEAAAIADGKELLGVGPRAVVTTHTLGYRQVDLEPTVVGLSVPLAAFTCDGGVRGVKNIQCHCCLSCLCLRPWASSVSWSVRP